MLPQQLSNRHQPQASLAVGQELALHRCQGHGCVLRVPRIFGCPRGLPPDECGLTYLCSPLCGPDDCQKCRPCLFSCSISAFRPAGHKKNEPFCLCGLECEPELV